MDEVFGEGNFVSEIIFAKTVAQTSEYLPGVNDFCLWFAKIQTALKIFGHSLE